MDLHAQLSAHFKIGELVATNHRTIDNTPTDDVVSRLRDLCNLLLEPIRDEFGPLIVSSGYRCPTLNRVVGSGVYSAHIYGCAADFMPVDKSITPAQIVQWIGQSLLPFDQVIDERTSTSRWVHAGIIRPGHETVPRKMLLMTKSGDDYVPFVPGQTHDG